MFICGNDEGAKKTVTDILNSFGQRRRHGKAEAAELLNRFACYGVSRFLIINGHMPSALKTKMNFEGFKKSLGAVLHRIYPRVSQSL
jgi:hypothetical protein